MLTSTEPLNFHGKVPYTDDKELSLHARFLVKFEEGQLRWLLKNLGAAERETEIRTIHEDYFGPSRLSFGAFHSLVPGFPIRIVAVRPKTPLAESHPAAALADVFRVTSRSKVMAYFRAIVVRLASWTEWDRGSWAEPPLAVTFPAAGIRGGLVVHNRPRDFVGTQLVSRLDDDRIRVIARYRDYIKALVAELLATDDDEHCAIDLPSVTDWFSDIHAEDNLSIPGWALRLKLPASQLLVLSAIAAVTTREGRRTAEVTDSLDGYQWWLTNVSDVADRTGISPRTVTDACAKLEQAGLIARKQQRYRQRNVIKLRILTDNIRPRLKAP